MGIAGSHFTAPILWRAGAWIPKLLVLPWLAGLKRYPITALGIVVTVCVFAFVPAALPWRLLLAWLFLGSIVLPTAAWVPATIRMRIGRPIAWDELFQDTPEPGEAELAAALSRVEGAVQALVDEGRGRTVQG
jgi:hypothetical protein